MKHFTNYFLGVLILLSAQIGYSQLVIGYSFSTAASTYSAVTGGTVLGTNNNDDEVFDNVPIGFTFNYAGVNFTQLSVSANGYIKPGVLLNPFNGYYPISDLAADDTIISGLGADIASLSNGVLRVRTLGVAPNRIFVAQWRNYTSYSNNDTLNFQIRLYETSNAIDVVYGKFYVDVYNPYEVGLRGILLNSDFNSRSVLLNSNTWATSIPATVSTDYCELDPGPPQFLPAIGRKYSWSPPPPCSGTPNAGSTTATSTMACVGQTLNLGLVGSTSASGLTYQWQSSPNSVVWSNIPSSNTQVFNVTFTSSIFYRCIVACGTNTAASIPKQIIPQTANVYALVPFLENFNNWQNRCDYKNVPVSANWKSNPTTGNDSWRRQDEGVTAFWSGTSGLVTPFEGLGSADFHSYDANPGNTGELDLYINMGTTQNYQMSFYHINESGDDSLEIFLSIDGGATFTKKAGFVSGNYSSVDLYWNQKTVSLGPVNSTSCVVRFLATSDYGFDDIGMDSLQIKTIGCTPPIVSIVASQPTVCSNGTLSLTASGAVTYTWNTTSTSSVITITPSVTTVYTVTGENSPGCSDTKTISINVTPGPAITFSASPGLTICPGGSASLTALGATNYTWTLGNQTTAAISVTPSISQTFNIIGSNSTGCTTNTSVTVFVVSCTDLISQALIEGEVTVFPNPTSDNLEVKFLDNSSRTIHVVDMSGRLIMQKTSTESTLVLDLKPFANGIYFVKVTSPNILKVIKIVKE